MMTSEENLRKMSNDELKTKYHELRKSDGVVDIAEKMMILSILNSRSVYI